MTGRERDWTISDEEYRQQALMPVETTRAVFTAIFGPQWQKGALSIFRALLHQRRRISTSGIGSAARRGR